MENHPHPRAILHLEFGRDGSLESWPRGDLFYLRESMRTLAGALLTEPATLDQVTGAAGIQVDPSSLWITTPPSAQDLCESTGTPKPRAFQRGINAVKKLRDLTEEKMERDLLGMERVVDSLRAILDSFIEGFNTLQNADEIEAMVARRRKKAS